MKWRNQLFYLLFAMFAIGCFSCGDDEKDDVEKEEKANEFTHGNVITEITGCNIFYMNADNENSAKSFYINLFSEKVSFSESTMEFSGSAGYLLNTYLQTSSKGLAEGKYIWKTSTETVDENIVPYLDFYFYGTNGIPSTLMTSANSETGVTITKTGDVYEIIIAGKDNNGGAKLAAYYKGKVKFFKFARG